MFSTFQLPKVIPKNATIFKIYHLHSYFAHYQFSFFIKNLMPDPFFPPKKRTKAIPFTFFPLSDN